MRVGSRKSNKEHWQVVLSLTNLYHYLTLHRGVLPLSVLTVSLLSLLYSLTRSIKYTVKATFKDFYHSQENVSLSAGLITLSPQNMMSWQKRESSPTVSLILSCRVLKPLARFLSPQGEIEPRYATSIEWLSAKVIDRLKIVKQNIDAEFFKNRSNGNSYLIERLLSLRFESLIKRVKKNYDWILITCRDQLEIGDIQNRSILFKNVMVLFSDEKLDHLLLYIDPTAEELCGKKLTYICNEEKRVR